MEGKWYTAAVATKDEKFLNTPTAPMRVFFTKMNVTPQENIKITLNKW